MRRPCVHVRRSAACRYKRRSISLLSTSVIQKSTFSTQPPSTSLIAFVAIERPCSCRADARTQKPENNHDGPCTLPPPQPPPLPATQERNGVFAPSTAEGGFASGQSEPSWKTRTQVNGGRGQTKAAHVLPARVAIYL